jgi:hypothetical protein
MTSLERNIMRRSRLCRYGNLIAEGVTAPTEGGQPTRVDPRKGARHPFTQVRSKGRIAGRGYRVVALRLEDLEA